MYMQQQQHPGGVGGVPQRMPYVGGGGGNVGPIGMGVGGGQRPPNVQVNPDGMPIGSQQEWRQMMMSQQQNMNFNGGNGGGIGGGAPGGMAGVGMRPGFNPGHQGEFN